MVKKIIFIIVPLVLIALVIFFAFDSNAKKEDILKTVAVARGTIVDQALAIGTIDPEKEISIKSPIAGIVKKTFSDIGDKVEIGDPLFDVAPDPTPMEYAEAKRQVELAEVSFNNVKREYERIKSLNEKSLISSQDYESKQAQYEESELRLNLAREKLALIESGQTEVAGRNVDNIIKSTIKGTVLSLLVEEGDPVVPLTSYQAGTDLMTLARMDDLIFKGWVDEIDVGKISVGMPAEIEIGALPGTDVTGVICKISPKAQQREGSTMFEIEITLKEQGESYLRAGYSANANIIINKRADVLMIPERLVAMNDSVSTVEVQDSAGIITTREVSIGLSDGINIEIIDGVTEGELIVERPPREIKPWD
ncbi:MAG: efflux RND transporter periplasmic adaptor subunit [candidate division Zixibacteria bacterium]|nr:efflux RND transporter periplasmic adaptor subunit [candidate division Zixibacteria bacterium]